MSRSSSKLHSARLRDPYPETVTTTIFISNLHCPSCVDSIQETLISLQPTPEFVSHSIVSHSVVLRHNASLAVADISASLEVAGFEVHSIFQDKKTQSGPVEVRNPHEHDVEWQNSLEQAVLRWTKSYGSSSNLRDVDAMPNKRQKHVEQCEQCKAEKGGVSLESKGDWQLPAKPEPAVTLAERISLDDDNDTVKSPATSTTDRFVVVESATVPLLYKATLSLSGMTCSSCVSSITHAVQQLPYVRSIDVNLLTSSGTVVFDGKHRIEEIVTAIEDTGFDASVEEFEEIQRPTSRTGLSNKPRSERWRATYVIGGMTCSSCVGNVTNALKSHAWIEKVDVNLVTNSATIVFLDKEHLSEITESIEDAGYDATLDKVVADDVVADEIHDRSLGIRVDGMFCHHCPDRIVRELNERFSSTFDFQIGDQPFSEKAPILYIRYLPSPPQFTIRHIFQAIESLDPSFTPSIYHPPTIEERAREMHARERRRVLFRLVLSVVIAIPTFLLGIVFMSLVKETNPVRHYIMQPMWAGNVPRVSWALFILATPIYFFAADTFHRRALKEIRALWRPGSRTPFLQRFYRFGSMNMLMSLGTSIAYFASIVELALAATRNSTGSMNDSYFDSVVFLTMFLLIGRFLEAYSKAKTGDAVTSLGKLRPTEATLVNSEEGDRRIATDLLEIGDIVRVPHGTSPPFDGIIIEGLSTFDESSLTGESRPVKKMVGETVFSGTINKGQPIKIKITTVSGTSMLDQIINVVREGQARRAPVERVADTITSHFVPFVTLVAILTWVIWLVLGTTGAIPKDWRGSDSGSGGWALWSLRFAIAVFVIACPCGIGLAAPTALFVGGGLAAKHGILVKGGGEAFQEASSLDCIVFDKTGTLTQGGDPAVTDHKLLSSQDPSVVLGIVKALEENSSHPIANAIVSFCNEHPKEVPTTVNVDEVPGKGLKGTFKVLDNEITAIIGNESYMADHHVTISTDYTSTLNSWKARGESVALAAVLSNPAPLESRSSSSSDTAVANDTWELAAIFAIADPIRPEAVGVIAAMKKRGIDVWMLSGDNSTTANAVGAQVGIPSSNIIAGVLPDQKAEKIKYLQKTLSKSKKSSLFRVPFLSSGKENTKDTDKRAIIAMVGDGINDAPALSTADLSIAIGSGSDVAVSSSSFILIHSKLTSLLTLLDLSRIVFRRVYFNFGWALVYNLVAMPIAAGVLFPITTGKKQMDMHHNGIGMEGGMAMGDGGVKHVRLDPVWASLAMALSSVSVVCSSLALRSKVPGLGFRARKEEAEVKEE
ncbi:E1-E2 ATPase-domain-containing protein [Lophiotrema nucula]|uniref:E1-E2 ATPase-domain-containing protein n=1 Tax=Lophiotrema nucula TaxID=690887 RepID=A0A6A5YTT4_9PLEO|nr:E1-E2 ATPase-domain-containing protein [Lophiotrema nucula]